jgi:hypothetical protein
LVLVRKIVIVLVGVSLALLVTVLLLNPDSLARFAASLSEMSAFVRLPLAILLDAIVLAVVVMLVRGERSLRLTTGLMVKAQGAIADVSIDSARDRILRAVRDVPDVLSAEATVKAFRGKADVELEVAVSHESASVPEKQREIDRALRQVINKQLGLQMAGKPRVHIRLDDEKAEALPVVTPALPVPVPAVVESIKQEEVAEPEEVIEPPAPVDSPDEITLTAEDEATADPLDLLPLS